MRTASTSSVNRRADSKPDSVSRAMNSGDEGGIEGALSEQPAEKVG